jgi:hypothetical protein
MVQKIVNSFDTRKESYGNVALFFLPFHQTFIYKSGIFLIISGHWGFLFYLHSILPRICANATCEIGGIMYQGNEKINKKYSV